MSVENSQKPWYRRLWLPGALLLAAVVILFLALDKRPVTPALTPPVGASPTAAPTDASPSASPPPSSAPSSSPSPLVPSPVSSPRQTPVPSPETGSSSSLALLSVTSPVSRNQTATVEVRGAPETLYEIAVYYSSGKSKAAGLVDKTSDADGYVSWSWKVGGSTKPGDYQLTVAGGGETLTVTFTVE